MAVNGTNTSSPSSLSRHDSEESFVVLSRSPGAEPQSLTSLNSTLPSMLNVASIPNTPSKDDVPPERSITASVVSDLSPEEIQAKMESILQENMELKEALTQNNIAMKKQFNTLVMWQEDVMKVHKSHKEKFEETKKLIASLRAENIELKKSASLPNSFTSGEDINALKSKISALEFELQTLREANIKYKMDHSKQVEEIQAKLESTEKEAQEKIKKLNAEKVDLNNKLKATEEKLTVALVKIEEMKSQIPSETELRNVDYLKAQIKELSEEVILKAKVLQEKTELTDKLHEEISKLKIENEVIPILKEQVEVYQTDFKQERLARTTLKEEKDRLELDLHHLHQRNEQLLQQIESSSFVHVSASTSRHLPTERQMSPPLASYDCPICQNRFRSMKILDEHIDSCLQNSN